MAAGRRAAASGAGRPRSMRATSAVLATSMIAYSVLQSMVSPILPTIQHELHTTQNTVTWVLTVYLLSASVFTPIVGPYRRQGRQEEDLPVGDGGAGRRLAARRAVTDSIGWLIVARAIQGIGGGVLPLVFGIIRDEFPPREGERGGRRGRRDDGCGSGLGIVLAGPIIEV